MAFCRNCARELAPNAALCVGCGVPPPKGDKFCQNCAKPVDPLADVCVGCGVKLAKPTSAQTGSLADASPKSRLAATLLSILPSFVLVNGIHRFYLGKIGTGILMLLTLGGLGVWTLIDFIFAVSGNMKDKEGKPIKTW